LKRMVVPVPSKPEQMEIARLVAQQRKHLEALCGKERSLESRPPDIGASLSL
jgi:hypothetical protein